MACQQDRAALACARTGPGRARRLLHPSDRDSQGRHDPGRLWSLRLGQLLFRLNLTTTGVNPCRISRPNIPPISTSVSTWARSSKSSARLRSRPASSRSAVSASAPYDANIPASTSVTPFRDESHAIEIANDVSYGLTGYVWTGDMGRALRVADALEAGMIWLNSENVRHLPTPFGGMKASGIGRDGGDYSFDFYMETKHVSLARGTHKIQKLGL